jgi:hypothetical protein
MTPKDQFKEWMRGWKAGAREVPMSETDRKSISFIAGYVQGEKDQIKAKEKCKEQVGYAD